MALRLKLYKNSIYNVTNNGALNDVFTWRCQLWQALCWGSNICCVSVQRCVVVENEKCMANVRNLSLINRGLDNFVTFGSTAKFIERSKVKSSE